MDSGKKQDNDFRLAPSECFSGFRIIWQALLSDAKRQDCRVRSREKFLYGVRFDLTCGDESIRVLQESSLNHKEVGPLLPPLVSPRPRFEHSMRRNDIRHSPTAAMCCQSRESGLPQSMKMHDFLPA